MTPVAGRLLQAPSDRQHLLLRAWPYQSPGALACSRYSHVAHMHGSNPSSTSMRYLYSWWPALNFLVHDMLPLKKSRALHRQAAGPPTLLHAHALLFEMIVWRRLVYWLNNTPFLQ